jgi:acylaminoacyl-peptidase
LLILNYSGSTGYGDNFLNSLLGNIGDLDVQDCGKLIKAAIEKHSDKVDPSKVAVYGASHGGFNTAWLIGHPDFKDLFCAAVLLNPVINLSYMYSASDIPDWILATCLNKEWSYRVTSEDNKVFFDKSPISVVQNVKTPSLILIGGSDKRVPPSQGIQYHHMLQDLGVPTKLYCYPEDGHAIWGTEPGVDVNMNIFFWFDQEFNK